MVFTKAPCDSKDHFSVGRENVFDVAMVSVSYQKSNHATCLSQADQIFNIFPRNLLRQLHNFCQNCWHFNIKKYNICYFYAQWNQSKGQPDMLKEGGIIQTLKRWLKRCSVSHTHCWKKSQACSHFRLLSQLNHTSLSSEGTQWPGYWQGLSEYAGNWQALWLNTGKQAS